MKRYEPPFNGERDLPVYHNHATVTQRYNYPNWHNNIEILYITEGEGSVLCGSVTHEAVAGDVFVINADNLHSATSNSRMKITYFIIENLFCKTNGIDVERTNFLTHVKSSDVAELCDKLVLTLESNSSFKSAEVRISLLNLMLSLSKNHTHQSILPEKQGEDLSEGLKLAMGYMKSHFNEELSLDRLAHEAGLSKFYFSRKFKSITGLTPVTYLNMLRCDEAKKLLKKNLYSIHEIAEMCGFFNDSYFSKTFKKHTGYLPSEFATRAK